MEKQIYKHPGSFLLEKGGVLDSVEITYHTYGKPNLLNDNVIWICHALTANSDAGDWWEGLVGENKLFDPAKHYIVCANILGSCYGTTGPLSPEKPDGKPYYKSFPSITIRDMVAAHELLRKQLGIPRINTLIGGSIGGQQALEWAVSKPEIFDNLVLLACNARTSPWMIALNESQRLALEADPTFQQQLPEGGKEGLSAARSIALISYRNHKAYNIKQAETDLQKTDGFKASSYQAYQGEKIVKRFDAYSYYTITKALDTHNIGRHRGSIEKALGRIRAKTLLIGINSDILFPPEEVRSMLEHIPAASYEEFDSIYGHDGFLVENEEISRIINRFFRLTSPVARNSKNKFIVN